MPCRAEQRDRKSPRTVGWGYTLWAGEGRRGRPVGRWRPCPRTGERQCRGLGSPAGELETGPDRATQRSTDCPRPWSTGRGLGSGESRLTGSQLPSSRGHRFLDVTIIGLRVCVKDRMRAFPVNQAPLKHTDPEGAHTSPWATSGPQPCSAGTKPPEATLSTWDSGEAVAVPAPPTSRAPCA